MPNYTAEQMREYQNRRRERLRQELIAMLGGKCTQCDETTGLQFDHVDPKTKLFAISCGLDKPRHVLLDEVAKCQLLCFPHHKEKSATEDRDRTRDKILRGERHRWTKLTEAQVREILTSDLSSRALGRKFGVNKSTIQAIRSGRAWKHISLESSNLEAQRPVKSSPSGIGGSNPSSSTQTDEHYPQGDI